MPESPTWKATALWISFSPARGLVFGGAAWIDYEGNGRKEIIITGGRSDESRAIIYEIDP